MSDLVERLRDVEGSGSQLAKDAADEIERLRAERDASWRDLAAAQAEVERLKAVLRGIADMEPGNVYGAEGAIARAALEGK